VHQMNQVVAQQLQYISGSSEKISANVAKAVRSLQFEDMTQQLISHMQVRLDKSLKLMAQKNALRGKVLQVTQARRDTIHLQPEIENLASLLESMKQLSATAGSSPISQQNIEASDIELF
jgi:methyl-accepting chemotaxis protein